MGSENWAHVPTLSFLNQCPEILFDERLHASPALRPTAFRRAHLAFFVRLQCHWDTREHAPCNRQNHTGPSTASRAHAL